MEIAKLVKKVVEEEYPEKKDLEILTTKSDDNRSYHINSDKVYKILGFKPKYTIEDAVRSLCSAFKANKIPDSFNNEIYFNVKRIKSLNVS